MFQHGSKVSNSKIFALIFSTLAAGTLEAGNVFSRTVEYLTAPQSETFQDPAHGLSVQTFSDGSITILKEGVEAPIKIDVASMDPGLKEPSGIWGSVHEVKICLSPDRRLLLVTYVRGGYCEVAEEIKVSPAAQLWDTDGRFVRFLGVYGGIVATAWAPDSRAFSLERYNWTGLLRTTKSETERVYFNAAGEEQTIASILGC